MHVPIGFGLALLLLLLLWRRTADNVDAHRLVAVVGALALLAAVAGWFQAEGFGEDASQLTSVLMIPDLLTYPRQVLDFQRSGG